MENEKEGTISLKEERIRLIAPVYYSRADIKKAIYSFSQKRETVPRYFEGFGKRPDSLQYESDITSLVSKGATSFHCSEEIWSDPLAISTDLTEEQMKELREGWDLLIDIDCKYLEYSKLAAYSIVKALEFHGIKNVGIKYSGSKGFHIIIPWSAFPKQVYGQETKNMFPEFPRMICQYITEVARPILEKEMEGEDIKFTSKLEKGIMCVKCKKMADDVIKVILKCPYCKREESFEAIGILKPKKCPDCRKEMVEKDKRVFHRCSNCKTASFNEPDNFKSSIDLFKVLGIDVILVSPRHLFRMPYSLHEKTALASVVIDKNEVKKFQVSDANPLKVTIRDFLPKAKEDEAKELLMQAIDWDRARKQEIEGKKEEKKDDENRSHKEIVIKDLTPDLYPPCISKILGGVKEDGRKRSLFILINFFRALKLDNKEIEKRVEEWDKKNFKSLKEGYIRSQLSWYERQKIMLPPNCDKPHYKDLGICAPDGLCRYVKNPVNYVIKKSFLLRKNENKKGKEKSEEK